MTVHRFGIGNSFSSYWRTNGLLRPFSEGVVAGEKSSNNDKWNFV